MKKIMLSAVIALSVIACKKEQPSGEPVDQAGTAVENAANTTGEAVEGATEEIKNVSNAANDVLNNAPSFGVKEADDFVASVKTYVGDVSKDPSKAAELTKTKGVELAKNFALAAAKLTPEQRTQLTEWYAKVSQALVAK